MKGLASLRGWWLSLACSSSLADYVAVARSPSLTSIVGIVTIRAVQMGLDYDYGNCLSPPVQYHILSTWLCVWVIDMP